MKKPKVLIANADDWQGLYVDGILVTEGHSVTIGEVLMALKVPYEELWCDKQISDIGCCPPIASGLRKD